MTNQARIITGQGAAPPPPTMDHQYHVNVLVAPTLNGGHWVDVGF